MMSNLSQTDLCGFSDSALVYYCVMSDCSIFNSSHTDGFLYEKNKEQLYKFVQQHGFVQVRPLLGMVGGFDKS